jgi:hypothetical protein
MGEQFRRVEQLEHRVQMLLGIFSAKGVLPLEFKPVHSAGDLLTQHLDELEHEAERKGGYCKPLPTISAACTKFLRLLFWRHKVSLAALDQVAMTAVCAGSPCSPRVSGANWLMMALVGVALIVHLCDTAA